MSTARPDAVLVDTNVFGLVFVGPRQGSREVEGWRQLFSGRPVAIAFQSREELLAGARWRNWGPVRSEAMRALLDDTPTIRATEDVIEISARLYAACRDRGHPLHQPSHRADRWIAACAAAYSLPVVSTDGIFDGLADLGVRRLEGSPG